MQCAEIGHICENFICGMQQYDNRLWLTKLIVFHMLLQNILLMLKNGRHKYLYVAENGYFFNKLNILIQ